MMTTGFIFLVCRKKRGLFLKSFRHGTKPMPTCSPLHTMLHVNEDVEPFQDLHSKNTTHFIRYQVLVVIRDGGRKDARDTNNEDDVDVARLGWQLRHFRHNVKEKYRNLGSPCT